MNQLFTKKNILNLLILGIMVLAIPLSINLIKHQQILKSRAASADIKFLTKDDPEGSDCVKSRGGKLVATCSDIKVRITAPTGAEGKPPKTAGIVDKVYAGHGCPGGGYTCSGNTIVEEQCFCDDNPDDPDACLWRAGHQSLETCQYGCSGGQCNAAPAPSAGGTSGGCSDDNQCPDGNLYCQGSETYQCYGLCSNNVCDLGYCAVITGNPLNCGGNGGGGDTCDDSACGAYWGKGASCDSSSGEDRKDGCYGGCTREAQACEGGQMWCVNVNCPDAACYDAEEGGSEVTSCPTTPTPRNCPDLPQYCENNQTYQCTGGRFDPSDPFAASDGCVRNCNPVSGDPLQCATGNVPKDPAGTKGCCSKNDDCKTGNNTPDGRSTAGWTCTDTNTRCIGSGNNACKPSGSPTPTVSPSPFTIAKYRYATTPTDVRSATWQSFPAATGSVVINYPSTNLTAGQKLFLFVQFSDASETTIIPDPPAQNKDGLEFTGLDPTITGDSCDPRLDLQDGSLIFKVKGQNFGKKESGSSLKADSTLLEIQKWADTGDEIIARLPNPSSTQTGHTYTVTLTRHDGALATQTCNVGVNQITLGAKWLCQTPAKLDMPNVDMSVFQMVGVGSSVSVGVGTTPSQTFLVGSKVRGEKVTVSQGMIRNIRTKLQDGLQYIVCLKASRSLRLCTDRFLASSGTNDLSSRSPFNIPFGDLNEDDTINSIDAGKLKQQWGKVTAGKNCDFNGDGICNSFEYSCMLRYFNKSSEEEPQ